MGNSGVVEPLAQARGATPVASKINKYRFRLRRAPAPLDFVVTVADELGSKLLIAISVKHASNAKKQCSVMLDLDDAEDNIMEEVVLSNFGEESPAEPECGESRFIDVCRTCVEKGFIPGSDFLQRFPATWRSSVPEFVAVVEAKNSFSCLMGDYVAKNLTLEQISDRVEEIVKPFGEDSQFSDRACSIVGNLALEFRMTEVQVGTNWTERVDQPHAPPRRAK